MEYELKIKFTDSTNQLDGLENVITVIGWCYQLKQNSEVLAELNGSTNIPQPNSDTFVGLDDVTLDMMVGWLEGLLDIEDLKLKLNNKL
jgi:hypothetical protein